ncbi:MAG: hypothetical protein U0231_09955 [Nitrospiraceae bacterium]
MIILMALFFAMLSQTHVAQPCSDHRHALDLAESSVLAQLITMQNGVGFRAILRASLQLFAAGFQY